MAWKIGEVTRRTGLSARALRFYEDQGLIGPVSRNLVGHRLYTQSDLLQLQQIRCMRLLGISLADMKPMLNDSNRLVPQFKRQLIQLRIKREAIQSLEGKLSVLIKGLDSKSVSSDELDEVLFQTLETMMMYEKYFKQSDINKIHAHGHGSKSELGTEEAWNQWVELMKSEIQAGSEPQSRQVQELMSHWNDMINHFTGDDDQRRQAFNELMHNEPQAREDHGIDDDLYEFMSKASGEH